jgi:hypothetical protein
VIHSDQYYDKTIIGWLEYGEASDDDDAREDFAFLQ